jgi:hypothetical protein
MVFMRWPCRSRGVRPTLDFIRQSCAAPWLDPTRIRALLATPPRLRLQLESTPSSAWAAFSMRSPAQTRHRRGAAATPKTTAKTASAATHSRPVTPFNGSATSDITALTSPAAPMADHASGLACRSHLRSL